MLNSKHLFITVCHYHDFHITIIIIVCILFETRINAYLYMYRYTCIREVCGWFSQNTDSVWWGWGYDKSILIVALLIFCRVESNQPEKSRTPEKDRLTNQMSKHQQLQGGQSASNNKHMKTSVNSKESNNRVTATTSHNITVQNGELLNNNKSGVSVTATSNNTTAAPAAVNKHNRTHNNLSAESVNTSNKIRYKDNTHHFSCFCCRIYLL